jgi:transglutaminase-like putative cysteine protease
MKAQRPCRWQIPSFSTRWALVGVLGALLGVRWTWSEEEPTAKDPQGLSTRGPTLLGTRHFEIEVGLRVWATGEASRLTLSRPVFGDWPEQEADLLQPAQAGRLRVARRPIDGLLTRLVVSVGRLEPGSMLEVRERYRVVRKAMDYSSWVGPSWKVPSTPLVRDFLLPSEGIEPTDPKIQQLAQMLRARATDPWTYVQEVWQEVRFRIKYQRGAFQGAKQALETGAGDCEDLSAALIALCRANRLPARTVWGMNHAWAEVALCDENGVLHWIPCDPTRESRPGRLSSYFPIYQKGDRLRVPELKGKVLRYVGPFCVGYGAQPQLEAIDQVVAVDGRLLEQPADLQQYLEAAAR